MPPLLKGLLIGFTLAVPVGPIGLLCIRRALMDGRLIGIVSGLGAAAADAIFGCVAALGLTAVTQALSEHRALFQLAGGVFLIGVGVVTLRSRPPVSPVRSVHATSRWMAFASTFVLTLMNPMTVVSFMGIFAALGIDAGVGGAEWGVQLVAGVFLGSALWFVVLSTAASKLGRRLQSGGLRMLNIVFGSLIAAYGIWQLSQLGF